VLLSGLGLIGCGSSAGSRAAVGTSNQSNGSNQLIAANPRASETRAASDAADAAAQHERDQVRAAVYARDFPRHPASSTSDAIVASDQRVTKRDILAWADRGMREDVIIDRIERSNSALRLTAA